MLPKISGKKFFLVAGFALLFCFTGLSQVASLYTFSQNVNTYGAIAGTNLSITGWDDQNYALAIPFNFNFNGTVYTTCNVNTNGYISFGGTGPATTNYTPISTNTAAYNGIVSAFARDLVSSGTRITYTTLNTAPNRILVVQWANAQRFNGTGGVPGDNLNFQIRLYETSNVAEVIYGGFTITSGTALTTQVGLRGAANTDYNNRTTTTNWSATTAGGTNNATCTSSSTVTPSSGLTFTWTPKTVNINTTGIQPAAANINQSSTDNLLAAYQVVTGNTAVTPSSFVFTTAGTYAGATDVTNFKLYQNSSNNLAGATLLSTVAAGANPQTITFNSGFTALAANSTTYFIITFDVPLSAVPGDNIYIVSNALTNFSFSTAVLRTGDNSPALQSNTQTITGPTVTISQAHPTAGNINQNSNNNPIAAYQMVAANGDITPSILKFTTAGTYANTADISGFSLYENTSNSLSGATLVGTVAGGTRPQTLTFNSGFSTITSGSTMYYILTANVALTATNGNTINIAADNFTNFTFTSSSGGGVGKAGTNPVPAGNTQTITGPLVTITQAHPAAGTINQNSSNNPIASYQMVVTNADALPSSFSFTTAGTYANATDISGFSLYQNSSNSLTGATLIGTVAGGTRPQTITFNSGFSNITNGSTVYFIVTADVALTATNGNTINIAADNLGNFSFTTLSGGTVAKAGTNPVPAGNTQTIVGPVVTITAAHPAAGLINQNSTNNIIASYQMVVSNSDVNATSFSFTTAGTYIGTTDISTFRLYMNNANNLSSPTLIGTITATGNPQTLTFNSGFTTTMTVGTWYFLITADVALSGLNGDNINIAAANLSNFSFTGTSGGTVAVSGTNPVTASNLKTIYGATVAISTSHPAANYITLGTTNNIIAAYQIDASNAASVTPTNITLTTAGTYAAGDLVNFKVYQNTGVTLTGATLVGTVAAPASGGSISVSSGFISIPSAGTSYLIITTDVGTNFSSVPHTVWFTSTALTNFSFTSSGGGGVQKTGTNPASLSNTQTIRDPQVAISTAHPIAGSILTGSQNNLVASFKLVTTYGTITPSSVTLTTGGTFQGSNDISIFNLYQNNANSLTGATLVGTVNVSGTTPTNTLIFNGGAFTAIAPGATNYLLLVADVAGTATPGRTVTITTTPRANFSFSSTGPVTLSGADPQGAPTAPGQTIVLKLDVYSSGAITWNTSNVNWGGVTGGPYSSYVWIATGIGQLEGTAGQLTATASAANPLTIRRLNSLVNNYKIDASSSTNGLTFTSPSEFNVTTGTTYVGGNINTNPVIYGNNGLSKLGAGELQIGSAFGSGFSGDIFVNAGELTLGQKSSTTAAPYTYLQNNGIQVDNSTVTIASSNGANGSLRQLSSFISTGNSILSLYRTNSSNGVYMNVIPSINNAAAVAGTYVPLTVEGQLTVNRGSSTNTRGIFGATSFDQNMIAFGSTTLTGNTTFAGYANNALVGSGTGDMININLGGYGHYLTGVTLATGSFVDNGYTMTFLGQGGTGSDGAELNLNASSSTMTGDWILGDAAGTNAGWLVTNTATCLTRGTVTIYNFSKFCPQLTSTVNVNLTYSPDSIYVYGLGPASQQFPSALDFYNFSGNSAGTTSLPSHIVLKTVYNSNVASIGSQVGGSSTTVNFVLNGTISGNGGLEKTGPGVLTLNTQNISGNFNTYADTTRVRNGTLTINPGSNMGTGPLHMYQLSGVNTTLNLKNSAQTVSSLTSSWTNTSGTYSQVINLSSGTVFTINQNVNTTFGNGNTSTLTAYIAGSGSVIKDGTGTLTLTGPNTYTGYTQVKGGILQLNRSGGTTLPTTANVHIIGGKLLVSTSQQLNDLTLSSGTLELGNNVTLQVDGNFTLVPTSANIILGTGAIIRYGTNGSLIYAGNVQQVTSVNTKELPNTNGPKNIAFNNYSTQGVQFGANINLTGAAVVNGWVNFNGLQIGGTGGTFTLNGLTNKTPKGTTTAGSTVLTNLTFTGSLSIGMSVSGTGIPANSYIIYIDPLVANSVTLNNAATATGSNITFDMNTRGGLMVNLAGGIDAHVKVTGAKTYNSGASYIFNTPTTGSQIYPAFPTVGTLNYSPAYDVTIQSGINNRVIMGASHDLEIAHDLTLNTGVFVTNNNLITWDNAGTLTAPEASYTLNSTNYAKSYIATCTDAGVPLSAAGPTTAFAGNVGFKIKNVGNTDTYFPVGASFLKVGSYPGVTGGTPNRMMINNQSGPAKDYTVIVTFGDIGFTNGTGGSLKVNRIWYVKSSGSAGTDKATMKLFYTKYNNTVTWPTGQNEVESGFNYANGALVQKDYTAGHGNFINLSSAADIPNFIPSSDLTEIYGQYTVGISTNLSDGITQFNRFSIVNPDAIILPVTITNVKAYQTGSQVRVEWTSLHEVNVDHYEVEKSTNAVNFGNIGNAAARNNGSMENNYFIADEHPVSGNNFYRIKIADKDGKSTYTIIVVVNISNGKASISVMPNPVVNKQMLVQLNNVEAGNYAIVVYSAAGQKVYYQKIAHAGGSTSQVVYLPANVSRGAYIVKIYNEEHTYTSKVIVE